VNGNQDICPCARASDIYINVEPLIITGNKGVEEWQLAIRFVFDGEGNVWVDRVQ